MDAYKNNTLVSQSNLSRWLLLNYVGIVLVALAITGCQNRSKKGLTIAGQPTPPSETIKPTLKSPNIIEFNASIIAGDLPNQYSVQLAWKVEGESKYKISRIQKNGAKSISVLQVSPENAREVQDRMVEPGGQYEYSLEQISTEQRKSLRVNVPQDLEIQGDVLSPSIVGYHRVFLQKASRVYTEGNPLKIVAAEIISDDATIISFIRSLAPNDFNRGRSGGRIEIVAESAKGRLNIIGNGENGRIATSGNDGKPGKAGEKGQPGKWGMNPDLYLPKMNISHNFLESIRTSMERENPPPDSPRWRETLADMKTFVCTVSPSDGTPGENGTDGRDGGTGGRGGDSAEININIKSDAGFNISAEAEPGIGSLGGRGGTAGKGGMGGEAGELDRGHLCIPAKQGASGVPGTNGLQGRVGENGIRKPICILVANRKEGDCHGKQ